MKNMPNPTAATLPWASATHQSFAKPRSLDTPFETRSCSISGKLYFCVVFLLDCRRDRCVHVIRDLLVSHSPHRSLGANWVLFLFVVHIFSEEELEANKYTKKKENNNKSASHINFCLKITYSRRLHIWITIFIAAAINCICCCCNWRDDDDDSSVGSDHSLDTSDSELYYHQQRQQHHHLHHITYKKYLFCRI